MALTLLHNAYVVRKGLPAPYIAQRLHRMPVDGASFMFLKEADTSTATPPPALAIPATTSITSGFSDAEIGGASPTGESSYSGGTWTVQGAGTTSGAHATVATSPTKRSPATAPSSRKSSRSRTPTRPQSRRDDAHEPEPGAPRAWMAVTPRSSRSKTCTDLAVYGGTNYANKELTDGAPRPRIG